MLLSLFSSVAVSCCLLHYPVKPSEAAEGSARVRRFSRPCDCRLPDWPTERAGVPTG